MNVHRLTAALLAALVVSAGAAGTVVATPGKATVPDGADTSADAPSGGSAANVTDDSHLAGGLPDLGTAVSDVGGGPGEDTAEENGATDESVGDGTEA